MAKPKPTLHWGILRGIYGSERDVMRVTKQTDRQVSGVRRGDITAITVKSDRVLATFATEELALEAIERERQVREAWEPRRREATANEVRVHREAREACLAALRGEV
ncbi:hypothetical protein [Caulobacter sp. BK020]|uniref:hypothetical protein n=1 Tax=Caulobacter sp. BK020 TaxID=2512117 RepID=UPI0010461350|nr:hypothetical protein [Caulobacter sp. BK020]TCS14568.1 hypothetical protein EV278_107217 [Caulobacter sp. BK020]